jgi:hypothetical protein
MIGKNSNKHKAQTRTLQQMALTQPTPDSSTALREKLSHYLLAALDLKGRRLG